MLILCSLIYLFVCVSEVKNQGNELENIMLQTTKFFDKLKIQYETWPANNETFRTIDKDIKEFVDKMKQKRGRKKRQLIQQNEYDNKGSLRNLKRFEPVLSNFSNSLDISFFIKGYENQFEWFVATVNNDGISILQLNQNSYVQIEFYPLEGGKSIMTDNDNLNNSTYFVIQKFDGQIVILCLNFDLSEKRTLYHVQTLLTFGSNHSTIWRGINCLYLGVATPSSINIYIWLGENFDLVQVIQVRTDKIIPLQAARTMIFAATGPFTRIFTFIVRQNKFIESQVLKESTDVIGFTEENNHLGEQFLVLVNKKSSIIYKEKRHRYVPFQEIAGAKKIQYVSTEKNILLFLIKRNKKMKVYQYKNWRFSNTGLLKHNVSKVYPAFLQDGQWILAIQNSQDSQWSLEKIKWEISEIEVKVKKEIKEWCESAKIKAERSLPKYTEKVSPLVFKNVKITNLIASKIQSRNDVAIENLTNTFNQIISRIKSEKKNLNAVMKLDSSVRKYIKFENVRVLSTTKTNNTVAFLKPELIEKLNNPVRERENFKFKSVKTTSVNFKCPIPAVDFQEVTVDGRINGINFQEFEKDVLKTNEDNQNITGIFNFEKLKVINADLPLDIATNFTFQKIRAKKIIVENLNTNGNGLLLPLNGNVSKISGTLTVPKVKVTGLIHMTGNIRGSAVKDFSFERERKSLILKDNYSFENVKIVNFLQSRDLIAPNGVSFKKIKSTLIPLNSTNIPVKMKFLSKNVIWKNVTINDHFGNWMTKNSAHCAVTGIKTVPGNIIISNSNYAKLPVLKLRGNISAIALLTKDIWTSNIIVDRATVKVMNAESVYGANNYDAVLKDSAKNWDEVPWHLVNLTGQVRAKFASISSVSNVNLTGLNQSISRWVKPGILKGPIKIKNLSVNTLNFSENFEFSLPNEIENLEVRGNALINKINGIKVIDFIKNVVKIDDMISLTNISFTEEVSINNLLASNIPIYFSKNLAGNFGAKKIVGSFKTKNVILPYNFSLLSNNSEVNIIVKGNVSFTYEPVVENCNDWNLEDFSKKIWMKNKPVRLTNKLFKFKNMTFEGSLDIDGSFNTPKLGPWSQLKNTILLNSVPQEIRGNFEFKQLRAPNIVGFNESKIISEPSSNLYDLEHNSMKKSGIQNITDKWIFEKVITNNLYIFGKINGLDLNTDAVKIDTEKNITTGKKIEKNIQIKNLTVDGTIWGFDIRNCFRKLQNQTITGKKTINGNLIIETLYLDSLMNDINLTNVIKTKLKKLSPIQTIKSPITFQEGLEILGNLTINGTYYGINLTNLINSNFQFKTFESSMKKLSYLTSAAEEIYEVLKNRATYWDEEELIRENSTTQTTKYNTKNETIHFDDLGICYVGDMSLKCSKQTLFFDKFVNKTDILLTKVVSVSEIPLIIFVTAGPFGGISIISYDLGNDGFYKLAELQIPGILNGSVETFMNSIYIALDLDDYTTVFRYDTGNCFKKYVLPKGDYSSLMYSLQKELLLVNNNGVWRIGGLAGTRLIYKT